MPRNVKVFGFNLFDWGTCECLNNLNDSLRNVNTRKASCRYEDSHTCYLRGVDEIGLRIAVRCTVGLTDNV
jgi:hypothetical protein